MAVVEAVSPKIDSKSAAVAGIAVVAHALDGMDRLDRDRVLDTFVSVLLAWIKLGHDAKFVDRCPSYAALSDAQNMLMAARLFAE